MRLDFGSNLAIAMLARDGGGGMVGCRLELVGTPGLDLVAQRRALAIGDRGMTRRGRAALLRFGFDRDVREACLRQIAADQRRVVIAVRNPRQEARWIVWEKFRERVRYVVGEHVLLDAVPCIE